MGKTRFRLRYITHTEMLRFSFAKAREQNQYTFVTPLMREELTAFVSTTTVDSAQSITLMTPTPDPEGPDLICPCSSWFKSEYLSHHTAAIHQRAEYQYTRRGTSSTSKRGGNTAGTRHIRSLMGLGPGTGTTGILALKSASRVRASWERTRCDDYGVRLLHAICKKEDSLMSSRAPKTLAADRSTLAV